MDKNFEEFYTLLDCLLKNSTKKNIIIYGCGRGGDFIRWFYETYYHKKIKFMMDRWAESPNDIILHLWALYYTYDENDLIINTTCYDIPSEFNDTGECWDDVEYTTENILNLWSVIYKDPIPNSKMEITYFDWLEYRNGINLMRTIRRKDTSGKDSHGYFPTDFRFFVDGLKKYEIDKENDMILDIGSGKGSAVFALKAVGFKKIGAVEYTENIFNVMLLNLKKAQYKSKELDIEKCRWTFEGEEILCYKGDASLMKEQLDIYNWFFLFNPFSLDVAKKVINNILKSLERRHRKIRILYAEPIAHNYLLSSGRFKSTDCIVSKYGGVSYYMMIYETV